MGDAVMIITTLIGLATAPGSPERGPASFQAQSPQPAIEDPCEGFGRVDGVPSPHDARLHTCFCAPVTGLRGQVIRVEVSCN